MLREAAFRLLAPERFVGRLSVDVPGAVVYLNGKPLGIHSAHRWCDFLLFGRPCGACGASVRGCHHR